jgi:CheY-like chemotaxis protein
LRLRRNSVQKAGYQVIEAATPGEAMSVVLSGRPFDVLVTDYAMPEMTGVELVTDALRHRSKLVAMIVSGYSDFDAVRAQLPGVTVLRKPFEPEQLFEALDGAVHAHRLHTGER